MDDTCPHCQRYTDACTCAPEAAAVALAELRRRWALGHTRGCQCISRPGRPCAELRRVCLEAGLWADLQQDRPHVDCLI